MEISLIWAYSWFHVYSLKISEKNEEMDKSKGSVFSKCKDPHAGVQAFPQQIDAFFFQGIQLSSQRRGKKAAEDPDDLGQASVGLHRFV